MMSGRESLRRRSPSWQVWVISIAVFALYVGGARDYLLILNDDTDYIRKQFGSAGLDYFTDYPPALRLIWTLNIACGLMAPVLLVMRNRWALATAVSAAIAQITLLAATFAFLDRWEQLGAATSWFDIGIGLITALFAGYCSRVVSRRDS